MSFLKTFILFIKETDDNQKLKVLQKVWQVQYPRVSFWNFSFWY